MEKYASVKDGALAVGRHRYSVAVVAETVSLRRSTAILLERFAAEGGKVVIVNRRPSLVDGAAGSAAMLRRCLASAPVVPLSRIVPSVRKAHSPALTLTR